MGTLSSFLRLLRSREEERPEILEVRLGLMNKLMVVILGVGFFLAILGSASAYLQSHWTYSTLYLAIYSAILLLAVLTRHLSQRFRTVFLVSSMFVTSLVILTRTGLSGVGVQILIAACVLAAVFTGIRAGLFMSALGVLAAGLIGSGMTLGRIPIFPQTMMTSQRPLNWIIAMVCFGMITGAMIIVPYMVLGRLRASLELQEKHGGRLKRSNEILKNQIKTRKRAERALSDANDIIKKSTAVAFLWKNLPGWPVEFVSENVKELFGYSAEEFMSGKVLYSKTISHEDLPRVTEEVNAYGKGSAERFTHMPYRIVAKDGTVKWVGDRTYIRRDKNGVITYHQGIVEDITERKRTEDALQEREEQFRLIYQMIPDPVNVVRTRDGICLDVNDRFVIHTGWTREEVVGKKFKNLNIWCDPGDRERMIEAVFRDGRIDNLEAVFRLKNGEKITALLSATSLTIGGERLIVSIIKDITERNRAQAALKESEEKYRFVVDNANEWMVLTQNERVVFANSKALKQSGYSLGELAQRSIGDLIQPEDRTEAISHYMSIIQGNPGKGNYEFRIIKRDGSPLWVRVNSFLVNWMGGPALLTFMNDISLQKEAEEEKEKLKKRLQRAQKMEAIGTLAGGVAHDLNNILSGIVSYPDLLLMQLPEDSPLIKPVMTIRESGKRAAAVVQDLLTLARRGLSITEPVGLNVLIGDYLKSAEFEKLRALSPHVRVEMRLAEDLPNIMGSAIHLQKTIMNLVLNAFEAMPEGGKVTISTQNRRLNKLLNGYDHVREGDYVTLMVSDTGVGISPGDRERIFEPFYTKKAMGRSGTGLGMAVVWGAVKDHRGYIDLESTPGKGTTFWLYFPVTKEEARRSMILSLEHYRGKGESILIVDDMEDQREIASTLLSRLGYSVNAVSSGEEAIRSVSRNRTDLLILDMIMNGGLDGLDTYREILKISPEQKAILASGYSETERVREAQRLGAGQYIRKPYTLDRIGLAVRSELDRPMTT